MDDTDITGDTKLNTVKTDKKYDIIPEKKL